jgi:hypothetical protein
MLLQAVVIAVLIGTTSAMADAGLVLQNEITPNHVEVPGTGVFFMPPEDFSLSNRFDGFVANERIVEVIVAVIRSRFKEIADGFTSAALKTRGVEAHSSGEIEINGAKARLIKATHPDGDMKWGKWIMLLESGADTIVVNGVFVSGDSDSAVDLETMLKGVVVSRDVAAAASSGEASSASGAETAEDGQPDAEPSAGLPARSSDTEIPGGQAESAASEDLFESLLGITEPDDTLDGEPPAGGAAPKNSEIEDGVSEDSPGQPPAAATPGDPPKPAASSDPPMRTASGDLMKMLDMGSPKISGDAPAAPRGVVSGEPDDTLDVPSEPAAGTNVIDQPGDLSGVSEDIINISFDLLTAPDPNSAPLSPDASALTDTGAIEPSQEQSGSSETTSADLAPRQ